MSLPLQHPEANLEGAKHFPSDAQPDPEPASPSLDEPDPGVFRHDPATETKH